MFCQHCPPGQSTSDSRRFGFKRTISIVREKNDTMPSITRTLVEAQKDDRVESCFFWMDCFLCFAIVVVVVFFFSRFFFVCVCVFFSFFL